jgi:hypothetical protein
MPTVKHEIVFGKTQKKCLDCWYACIQMVRSSIAGTKTKPDGAATQKHRARFFTGKKLDFTSKEGTAIMEENNLINISDKIDLDDIDTLYKALQTYGPVIIGGDFALLNTQGHFVVVSGCDTGKTAAICGRSPARTRPRWGRWSRRTRTGRTWRRVAGAEPAGPASAPPFPGAHDPPRELGRAGSVGRVREVKSEQPSGIAPPGFSP